MDTFTVWLQSRLAAHGFPTGVVDGQIGPLTIAALKAFEAARGLPADGTADGDVVAELRKPASQVKPSKAVPDRDEDVQPLVQRNVWPRQRDVERYFGKVGTNQARVALPFSMKLAWDTDHEIDTITLHEKVADSAARCFDRIADAYTAEERAEIGIDLFGGSLNVRKMRGGSRYSMHSWGIAIDFDPARNQLRWTRAEARLAASDAVKFWQIWEDEGWLSLGRARDFDWMHVQAARL